MDKSEGLHAVNAAVILKIKHGRPAEVQALAAAASDDAIEAAAFAYGANLEQRGEWSPLKGDPGWERVKVVLTIPAEEMILEDPHYMPHIPPKWRTKKYNPNA